MANKSLTDLTARTATADSDLLHINSGGTDYKETKSDFLEGEFNTYFTNNSLLTTQVDSLTKQGTYFGRIEAYGHTTETGVPVNEYCWVKVLIYSSAMRTIEIWGMNSFDTKHYYISKLNGTWGSWTQAPSRAEITSLNNSLTNTFVTISAASSAVSITRNNSYRYGNVLFVGVRFNVSSAVSIYGYVLQIPSTLRCPTDVYAPLMSSYFTTMDGRGLYLDAASYTFRASESIPAGDYTFYCPILVGNAS